MAHPEIVPGLKVRYNGTAYRLLRGKVRVVTRVHGTGVGGVGVEPGETDERTLADGINFRETFWERFELVEDESSEGDAQSDDGAAGVWVVWTPQGAGGADVLTVHVFQEERQALRAALDRTHRFCGVFGVTFVEYGSDVRDVIRANR